MGGFDPEQNPFSRYARSFLSPLGGKTPENPLPANWLTKETDAHLGISGLPQSATGQTALWTGVNASAIMGRHMTGFPGPTLIRTIRQYSLLKVLQAAGKKARFLNAYHDKYLEFIQKKPRFISTSTHIQWAADQQLLGLDDLKQNKALYMDITHEIMNQLYPQGKDLLPVKRAFDRGQDFVLMARDYDVALFEYFLSDKAGHERSFDMAKQVIETLEDFLAGIVEAMEPTQELLLVSSDHGNLENLAVKTHTHNRVPTFSYGCKAELVHERVEALTDIPLLIYELLGVARPEFETAAV